MVMGVGAHERAATMLGRALPCAAHVWPCRDREDSLRWPCNAVITVQLELAEPYYVSLTKINNLYTYSDCHSGYISSY